MAKLTIFHAMESLDYIAIGETITIRKTPDANLDMHMMKAYYNGNEIGCVAANVSVAVPGTKTNNDIFDLVPDEFQALVTGHGNIAGQTMRVALVVEITGLQTSSTNTQGCKIFTFSVSGSSSAYPGKSEVISEFASGKKVFLQLKNAVDKKGNPLVVAYRVVNGQEVLCGKINEQKLGTAGHSSTEDYALIQSLIEAREQAGSGVEGVVSNQNMTSFVLQVQVANDDIAAQSSAVAKKATGGIIAKLVADGWDENHLNQLNDDLIDSGFKPDQIQHIMSTYKKYPADVAWRIPKRPSVPFKDTFGALPLAYAATVNCFHILCSGDKGTGKNKFTEWWAYLLQRPLFSISINRETDKLDVLGGKTIELEVDANGKAMEKIVFSPEVFLQAADVGGIMNIDEINFADAGTTALFHSMADDRREIEVPGYKKVVADENFCIIGTMNIDYQGTNELNEALADRFIDIKFPSNASIAGILVATCPKAAQSEIQIADNIYKQMYSLIQNRDSSIDSNCLTVRGFIQALKMSPYVGLKKALEVCVADKIKDEEYCSNVKVIIDKKCK